MSRFNSMIVRLNVSHCQQQHSYSGLRSPGQSTYLLIRQLKIPARRSLEVGIRLFTIIFKIGLKVFSACSAVSRSLQSDAKNARERVGGFTPPRRTTAVKHLNRYFCFLLLGFHLPVSEKWAKMYKSVSQHNYLSIFPQILSFFR